MIEQEFKVHCETCLEKGFPCPCGCSEKKWIQATKQYQEFVIHVTIYFIITIETEDIQITVQSHAKRKDHVKSIKKKRSYLLKSKEDINQ